MLARPGASHQDPTNALLTVPALLTVRRIICPWSSNTGACQCLSPGASCQAVADVSTLKGGAGVAALLADWEQHEAAWEALLPTDLDLGFLLFRYCWLRLR